MVCRFGRSEIFISAAITRSDLNRHRHPADGVANSQPLTPVLLHLCGAEIAFMSPEMIHPSQRILLVSGNKSNKKQIKNSNLLIETPGGMHCGAPLRERAAVRTRKISSLQPASGPFPLPLERIPGPQKHLYR